MTITVNTKAYAKDRVNPDSIDFVGPANTLSRKDVLQTKRIYPKRGGGTDGVARPSCKITRTVTVNATTGAAAEGNIRVEGSLPVGMSAADVESLLADVNDFIGSATGKKLFTSLSLGD